jgi:hypothetical protein
MGRNDAYAALTRLGDIVTSGPTNTSAGDLQVLMLSAPDGTDADHARQLVSDSVAQGPLESKPERTSPWQLLVLWLCVIGTMGSLIYFHGSKSWLGLLLIVMFGTPAAAMEQIIYARRGTLGVAADGGPAVDGRGARRDGLSWPARRNRWAIRCRAGPALGRAPARWAWL